MEFSKALEDFKKSWFRVTLEMIKFFESLDELKESMIKEEEETKIQILAELQPKLKQLKHANQTYRTNAFLTFLCSTYPPKIGHQSFTQNTHANLLQAISLFHPDQQGTQDLNWIVLCEEVTKLLNQRLNDYDPSQELPSTDDKKIYKDERLNEKRSISHHAEGQESENSEEESEHLSAISEEPENSEEESEHLDENEDSEAISEEPEDHDGDSLTGNCGERQENHYVGLETGFSEEDLERSDLESGSEYSDEEPERHAEEEEFEADSVQPKPLNAEFQTSEEGQEDLEEELEPGHGGEEREELEDRGYDPYWCDDDDEEEEDSYCYSDPYFFMNSW